MEIINILVVGFAIYGVFAIFNNFSESKKRDASLFKQQLYAFQAKNPHVKVSCSGPGACRYYVLYRMEHGQTAFQFVESHRDAKWHASQLRALGTEASISWIGPSQELQDPWLPESK